MRLQVGCTSGGSPALARRFHDDVRARVPAPAPPPGPAPADEPRTLF